MLNRAVGKMHLFGKDADFEAFQRVMIERTSGSRSASVLLRLVQPLVLRRLAGRRRPGDGLQQYGNCGTVSVLLKAVAWPSASAATAKYQWLDKTQEDRMRIGCRWCRSIR